MAETPSPAGDTPAGWDLEWQPTRGSGGPGRWPPAGDAVYAEMPVRAAAFAIDAVIVLTLAELLSQALGIVLFWIQRGNEAIAQTALLVVSAGQLLTVLAITGAAVYFWRVFRATPGHMVFGLFVIRRGAGTMLSRGAAVTRWLVLYAPLALIASYSSILQVAQSTDLLRSIDPVLVAALVLIGPLAWYAVLAISTLADERRGRGLHDRAAGSVVARRAGPPA